MVQYQLNENCELKAKLRVAGFENILLAPSEQVSEIAIQLESHFESCNSICNCFVDILLWKIVFRPS